MRFEDKVVVVTGGGSGVGRVMSRLFAAEGAAVVVADVAEESAGEVTREITGVGGTALPHRTDVSRPAEVAATASAARETFGPVDILINNAAMTADTGFLDITEEAWDREVDIALKGSFLCSQAVLPDMIDRGSGAIINISSVNALAYYGNEAYSAAKAGILSLTRSLAVRYGPDGVRANAIVPGTLRTPAWSERERRQEGVLDRVSAWYPLGRVGEPEDVANAVLFLASDEASWITGVALPVDGGLTAGNRHMTRDILERPAE